jgi:hypothetical protein
VLPRALKSYVAGLVWLDATGNSKAPPAAGRTPTLRSIGVYLSRLGAIATDVDRGLESISSDSAFASAELNATRSAAARKRALLAVAFEDFQEALTDEERHAMQIVREIVRRNESFSGLIIRDLIESPDDVRDTPTD